MTPAGDPKPAHVRIADDIRQKIADGEYQVGERIPPEPVIAEAHGVSRPIVRLALQLLRADGTIKTLPGRGSVVRPRPILKVRDRTPYRRPLPGESTSPFARDAIREGKAPDWDWDTVRTRADPRVAERLQISVGDHVMRTTYLFKADGWPVQASTSWEPYDLVGGTPIEEPEGEGRIVGVIARFDSIGINIDRVSELVHSRRATDEERVRIDIPEDVWVITIEREQYATNGRVAEIADIVIPADRYALYYDIPVQDAPPEDHPNA